jgi:hypothetical protein
MSNMPLIVRQLFRYALATSATPARARVFQPPPSVFLSLRG